MKRFFGWGIVAILTIIFIAACDKEDMNYHVLGITSSSNAANVAVLYADQTSDIINIRTSDSWEAQSSADWLLFATSNQTKLQKHFTYVYGRDSLFTVPIIASANTTGATRSSIVKVKANGRTVGLSFFQTAYLNITDPMPAFQDAANHNGASFSKTCKANETSASITFTIYQDATLASNQSWATTSADTYAAGTHTAAITLEPNTTGASRTATLTLRSADGIESVITLTQGA